MEGEEKERLERKVRECNIERKRRKNEIMKKIRRDEGKHERDEGDKMGGE